MFKNINLRVPPLTNEQCKNDEEQLPIKFDFGEYKEKISEMISKKMTKNNDFDWILCHPNDAYLEQVANEAITVNEIIAVNESNEAIAANVAKAAQLELEVNKIEKNQIFSNNINNQMVSFRQVQKGLEIKNEITSVGTQ